MNNPSAAAQGGVGAKGETQQRVAFSRTGGDIRSSFPDGPGV